MKIQVSLRVKFRAFGITFGTYSKLWTLPYTVPLSEKPRNLLSEDERGVTLSIDIVPQ